jgi:PAS domain S-box-containing protein
MLSVFDSNNDSPERGFSQMPQEHATNAVPSKTATELWAQDAEWRSCVLLEVLNHLEEAVTIRDATGAIIYANRSAQSDNYEDFITTKTTSIHASCPSTRSSPRATSPAKAATQRAATNNDENLPRSHAQAGVNNVAITDSPLTLQVRMSISPLQNTALHAVVDAFPHAFCIAKADGAVEFFNKTWAAATGHSDTSLGWGWSEVIHPDDAERLHGVWTTALHTGTVYKCEYRLRDHAGIYRHYHSSMAPLRNNEGTIIRWVGAAIDRDIERQLQIEVEAERALFLVSRPSCD